MNIKELVNGYRIRRYKTLEKKINQLEAEKKALKKDIMKAFELSAAEKLEIANYELTVKKIDVKETIRPAYSYLKLNIKKAS